MVFKGLLFVIGPIFAFLPKINCDETCDLVTNSKTSIKKNLHSIFESRNSFLKPSEFNVNKAIKKYSKKVNAGKIKHKESEVNFEDQEIWLENCGCHKIIQSSSRHFKTESLCSQESTLRGDGQKVIGFSYYGDPSSHRHQVRNYLKGLEVNIKNIKKFYPGWIIRIYHNFNIDSDHFQTLCKITCSESIVDLCDIQRLPSLGNITLITPMIWRFMPVLDFQVDYFMSRDLDSLIIEREVTAVKEWLRSNKTFHILRDHPLHRVHIMGGLWAMKLTSLADRSMVALMMNMAAKDEVIFAPHDPEQAYHVDQIFLKRYFWPLALLNSLSHDSYFCNNFGNTTPFSTQRKVETRNFVGSAPPYDGTLTEECPLKCRKNPDWTYC